MNLSSFNIAFFSKELPSDRPNGVSKQVHYLAEALSRRGHRLTVFTFSPPPADALYTVCRYPRRACNPVSAKLEPGLRFKDVDTGGFDILHYHGDDYLVPGSGKRVRTFYGSAFSEAIHARRSGRRVYQALFYLFEWFSLVKRGCSVGISGSTRRFLPFIDTLIPCGIPVRENELPGEKTTSPTILFLGDMTGRKRGSLMVSTFVNTVLPVYSDARLWVVGPEPVSAPGVEYRGVVSEEKLLECYRQAWIYCSTSSYEGFGVPLLEAMAAGTPVITTGNAGAREIIHNGENGRICSDTDLGEELLMLLDRPGERAALSVAGKQSAAAYSIDTIARTYECLYRRVKRKAADEQ